MADLTTEERLAALQARRRAGGGSAAPAAAVAAEPAQPQQRAMHLHAVPRPAHQAPHPPEQAASAYADATVPLTLPLQQQQAPSYPGDQAGSTLHRAPSTADPASLADPARPTWSGSATTRSILETDSSLPSIDRIVSLPSLDSLRIPWSWNRAAATGASLVSFAAMVVAMGPLLEQSETSAATATDAGSTEATDGSASLPQAPEVGIQAAVQTDPNAVLDPGANELAVQTDPNAVLDPTLDPLAAAPADGASADATVGATAPATAAPTAGATSQTRAPTATPAPQTSTQQTQAPAATSAPATQPPQTQAPAPTQPPQTQAPTTAPPQTQAPTTQPPTTAPPTTPASTTAPPTTAASGG
jgi:hypothetical protein